MSLDKAKKILTVTAAAAIPLFVEMLEMVGVVTVGEDWELILAAIAPLAVYYLVSK